MQFLMDQHRNPRFRSQTRPGNWEFNGWSARQIQNGIDNHECPDLSGIFKANDKLEYDQDSKYITIGKVCP